MRKCVDIQQIFRIEAEAVIKTGTDYAVSESVRI
jgi:hypothetical protein